MIDFKFELEGDLVASLDRLEAVVLEKVVRSGAAGMASAIAAEVEANVAKLANGAPVVVNGETHEPGTLQGAIYWAFDDRASTDLRKTYGVSWNRSKAPHGHLIEFGHWRVNRVYRDDDGHLVATRERLPEPEFVPAQPFLRPALAALPRAIQAGMEAMRRRFAAEAGA